MKIIKTGICSSAYTPAVRDSRLPAGMIYQAGLPGNFDGTDVVGQVRESLQRCLYFAIASYNNVIPDLSIKSTLRVNAGILQWNSRRIGDKEKLFFNLSGHCIVDRCFEVSKVKIYPLRGKPVRGVYHLTII